VQSFSDHALRFLGRRHDERQARAAVETALAAAFDTVSVDLIFGIPGQSPEAWRRDLEAAAALSPGHVSCYQLTIHERTRFGVAARRGHLTEMPEAEQAVLFDLTHRLLADAGYRAYEVSNFARATGHESRHNRKYWDHTPYLGLGPSAHSLAVERPAAARRWWNVLRTPGWEARIEAGERPVEAEESLGPRELATEAVLLGLRTADGIAVDGFAERFGFDLLAANAALVSRLAEGRLLALRTSPRGERALVPTVAGFAVADGLAAAFEIPLPTAKEARP
jgi:oxygen-independent coproporphyrinogen-3 oxidase